MFLVNPDLEAIPITELITALLLPLLCMAVNQTSLMQRHPSESLKRRNNDTVFLLKGEKDKNGVLS